MPDMRMVKEARRQGYGERFLEGQQIDETGCLFRAEAGIHLEYGALQAAARTFAGERDL